MVLDSYCLCYTLEVGVTVVGFLHLNAALYFWARASTFEPIYMWFDILIAACYTVRATYFFLMLNLDATVASRKDYFNYNKYTMFGLGGLGFCLIVTKWLEWGHPPTWTIVSWSLVAGLNYYHWNVLADYAGITDGFASNVQVVARGAEITEGTNLIALSKEK